MRVEIMRQRGGKGWMVLSKHIQRVLCLYLLRNVVISTLHDSVLGQNVGSGCIFTNTYLIGILSEDLESRDQEEEIHTPNPMILLVVCSVVFRRYNHKLYLTCAHVTCRAGC